MIFCETCEKAENCEKYIEACKQFCLSCAEDRTALEALDKTCLGYRETVQPMYAPSRSLPRYGSYKQYNRNKFSQPSLFAA